MNDNSFVQKLIALEVALNDGKSLGDGLADDDNGGCMSAL